jgi:hypothetical protein
MDSVTQIEDEDDDENSLPDGALRSVGGSSVAERSREDEIPYRKPVTANRQPPTAQLPTLPDPLKPNLRPIDLGSTLGEELI